MTTRLLGIQIANGYSPEARVFARLLAGQDPGRVKADVLCHDWGSEGMAARFREAAGVPVQALDFGWRSIAAGRRVSEKVRARLKFLAALPRAAAQARKLDPDVIYSCQQLWDCQAAGYIARRLGKPQIIHLHYIIGPWLHRPVLQRLLTCDHVVTVSDFIRDEALRHGVPPARVTTIRNVAPALPPPEAGARAAVRQELGLGPDWPLLGIVARLDPTKGQADTLRAFSQVCREHPDARLLVVGAETPWHPGYTAELKALAEELGLADRTHFLGLRSDVPRLLASLDVFVHPTRQDPCPLALLEASAAGLPVVAYAEGGANELVADSATGLLANPGDVADLAACLTRLLARPEEARQMGEAGRVRLAADFRPEQAAARFTTLLDQGWSRPNGRKKSHD